MSPVPTNPNSSPTAAKIKSVCFSGRNESWVCTPRPNPRPVIFPDPAAIVDCKLLYPDPEGSFSGLIKEVSRSFWYGAIINHKRGSAAKIAATPVNKYFLLKSEAKRIPINPTIVRTVTPKDGWMRIKTTGIAKRKRTLYKNFSFISF